MATGFSSTRPRRQAGSHGRSQTRPRMAGKDVALPVQHEGGGVAPLRDQPDVLGNGRMGRTRPLAVDDLVEVVRVGSVGRGRAAPASRLDLARRHRLRPWLSRSQPRILVDRDALSQFLETIQSGFSMDCVCQPCSSAEKPLCLAGQERCAVRKPVGTKAPLGVSSISQCRKAGWCAPAAAPRPSGTTRGCGRRRPAGSRPSGRWSSRE